MYQIKCDGYVLYDPRDDELIVDSPKVNLEVNTVGEGSFTIHANHPYYGTLKKLKSVFEVSDEIGVIFRGRMTGNSYDFNNSTFVDLEGAMAYFNDSTVRPYAFPDDWANDAAYRAAAASGNVIEFFLNWLIKQHNAQVSEFQKFKLGNVTVTDPNNYLSRSDSKYPSTWETLKSKLFDSGLGGYLCIRYETDGNYIDYLQDFELTNTQEIVFGENLLDLKTDSDATETYSAVIPIGADMLTIEGIADGNITDDIVKQGDMIYSKSAVEAYGWIFAPISVTTWDEVTVADNLLSKGVAFLTADGLMLTESMEAKAIDLHFTDAQAQSFRIYRKVKVRSGVHGFNGVYQMPKLALDLQKPQNTVITVGATHRTLTEQNAAQRDETKQQYDYVLDDLKNVINKTDSLENQISGIEGQFFYIKYSQYSDGHVMTDIPNENTFFIGTCSTNKETAPTDYREYTWCKVRGDDGRDGTDGTPGANGSSSFFHVKYSDDGKKFTGKNELSSNVEDWKSGLITGHGTINSGIQDGSHTVDCFSFKKVIPVEPGSKYYVSCGNPDFLRTFRCYDVDGNYKSTSYIYPEFPKTIFSVPDGIYYIRFMMSYDEYNSDDFSSGIASGDIVPIMQNVKELGETLGLWLGTCVNDSEEDPTDFDAYKWTKIVGEDGKNGIDGVDGKDGDSCYFFVKFSANANGNPMTETPQVDTKYMGVCSTTSATAPTSYSAYKWTQCRGEDGRDGIPGANGSSQYFHVKYSNDGKTFTSNNGETLGDWIGTCVNDTEADPTSFSAYTWKKIVGADGKNGIDGVDGTDGESSYFFVKFSPNSNGSPMYEAPDANTKYMGVCSTTSPIAPTSPEAYRWTQCRGEDGTNGTPGAPGADGRTQYLHIKYSDDGETFTANNGETLGAWIGTLVDFTEADSTVFSDYTWKKFTEDVDGELCEIRRTITEQKTDILKTSEEVTLSALKSYVQTSAYEDYKATLNADLSLWAKGISGRVSATETSVKNVDGDLQTKYNLITKYFTFDINGLQIGAVDADGNVSPNKVVIDNDDITIMVNNIPIQTFRADGTAMIPELKIKTSMNLLGLNVTQDDNHINCDFIGVVT